MTRASAVTKAMAALALALLLPACSTLPADPASTAGTASVPLAERHVTELTQGWRFRFGDPGGDATSALFDDSSWEAVSVPHSWNRIGEYALTRSSATNNAQGIGWYRLHVDAPIVPATMRQYLDFAAVGNIADVWVNGQHMGQHRGAFSRFRLDVTAAWRAGETNLVAVRADNSRPAPGSSTEHVIPLAGDFFVHGGIYREASLLQLPALSIDPLDYGGPGVYARTSQLSDASATVEVTTRLRNAGHAADANLTIDLRDATDTVVASLLHHITGLEGDSEITRELTLTNPHRWNGRADPYLYTMVATLSDANGQVLDLVRQPLGLRDLAFDQDTGFALNGEHLRLLGVSRHQDWAGSGWALSPAQHRRDMELIAEMGANSVRHAHYQHADAWSELADEFGMVTSPELSFVGMPAFTGSPGSPELWANAEQQLREQMRQLYNHPSVAMWSIGNEIDSGQAFGIMAETPQPLALLQRLQAVAREEDPHRPTIMADFSEQPGDLTLRRQPLTGVTDLIGYNRYPGWYYLQGPMAGRALGEIMDRLHAANPGLPIAVTEYGAGGAPSQHSDNPLSGYVSSAGRPQPEEYQALVHELLWPEIAGRDYIFGSYIWNMFDFSSDLRNEGDSVDINTKGLVTQDRLYRKDAFYYYQAAWNTAPMLHITGQGYRERSYPVMDVKAYSNAGAASLIVNGRVIGEAQCPNFTCVWRDVALAPGANAMEVRAGELAASAVFDGIDPQREGLFIDAGNSAVGQHGGHRYGSDSFVTGGAPMARNPGAIGARNSGPPRQFVSSTPALFDFWREGEAFSYALPLPPGEWLVTLRLLDPATAPQPDQQLRVLANDAVAIAFLGIAGEAGGQGRELVQQFEVGVGSNGLRLDFISTGGVAGLAAIEIAPAGQ